MSERNFQAHQIVYEDNHLLIVNKLPGQLVQGDKTGDKCLLDEIKSFIKTREHKPGNVFLGLVHRIDRPTSGLVIFAKTSKALTRLTQQIKERNIHKTYRAWVEGVWPYHEEITLENWLRKNEKVNKSFVSESEKPGYKRAVSKIRCIEYSGKYSLLEIELITGRHHQIRTQLSHLGFPIKGDLKYGAKRSNPDGGISLCAFRLEFEHPTLKNRIKIEVDAFER